MSDNLKSPPSSSKSSGESQTTPTAAAAAASKRNSDVSLQIRKQPPAHVFPDEWFDVEFELDGPRNGPKGKAYHFVVSLLHAKTGKTSTKATLECEPTSVTFSPRATPPKRVQRLKCRIRSDRVSKDRTESYRLSLAPDDDQTPELQIDTVSTTSITLVNHKVKVSTSNKWEHIWFKDEGGREKSMTVTAGLYDKENKLHTGEFVPLRMTLYYANENGQPMKVMKQDILRSVGTSKQCIDKLTGKCTLRFRIDDVSKNHQGQNFRVQIAPSHKAKGFQDVAPGFTPPVSVRSKRNKRQRPQHSTGRSEARLSPGQRLEEGLGMEGGPFPSSELLQLREAMKGVLQWTEEVISGLYPLQWQVIGYHPGPDGNPDYNHPFHNMPNPNPCISRVLGMYTETTRDQLGLLASAIDRCSGVGENPPYPVDSSGPPSIPRHGGSGDGYGMRGGPIPLYAHSDAFREPYPPPQMMRHAPPHPIHAGMGMAHGPPPSGRNLPLYRPQHPPAQQIVAGHIESGHSPLGHDYQKSRENEVGIILAKQYRSTRTENRLGFPAYTDSKELIGFYRENSMKVGVGQFVPLSQHGDEFGPTEIMQATDILNKAIRENSDAVHTLKDWGSLASMLEHALVYEWSKDIGGSGSSRSSPGGGGGVAVE